MKGWGRRTQGLTLIELLAVVAVALLMLLFALPALLDFYRDSRMAASVNRFTSGLQFARAQALVLHTTVRLCKITDASPMPPRCATGSSGYETGWMIYADPSPPDYQPNSPEDVLLIAAAEPSSDLHIRGNTNVVAQVAFAPAGNAVGSPNGIGNGTIVLCDARGWADNGRHARVVVVSTPGRIRTVTGDASTVNSC